MWAENILNGHTQLHIFKRSTETKYFNLMSAYFEVLQVLKSKFGDDNVSYHRVVLLYYSLKTVDIHSMLLLLIPSSDHNTLYHE